MTGVPTSLAWWAFDPARLSDLKDELGLTVSVCLPARNEAPTVGEIVAPIRRRLVDGLGLVDEVVVIDDGSSDATAAVALAAGADVVPIDTILPEEGEGDGKGNVIWRSLAASSGDLVCWVDADIRNFELHFVTGLLGPLLADPAVQFVKGHCRRPLDGQPTGGGRVSELVARPLLSRFFPELAAFAQPLAGEYAGRRTLLDSLPIVEGWGVEVAMLIDAWRTVGMSGLAQVDLGVREHRNRPLDELSVSATAILSTVLERAGASSRTDASSSLLRFAGEAGVDGIAVPFVERPPMRTRPGYRRDRLQVTGPPGDHRLAADASVDPARPVSQPPDRERTSRRWDRDTSGAGATEPPLPAPPATAPTASPPPARPAPAATPPAPGVDR